MYRLLIQSPVVGRACANCVGICARLRFTFFVSFTTGATNLPPPCGRGAPAGRVVLVAGATPGGAAPALWPMLRIGWMTPPGPPTGTPCCGFERPTLPWLLDMYMPFCPGWVCPWAWSWDGPLAYIGAVYGAARGITCGAAVAALGPVFTRPTGEGPPPAVIALPLVVVFGGFMLSVGTISGFFESTTRVLRPNSAIMLSSRSLPWESSPWCPVPGKGRLTRPTGGPPCVVGGPPAAPDEATWL